MRTCSSVRGTPPRRGPDRAGWSCARATLEPRAIVSALDRGEFYASNGVVLDDVAVTKESLTVNIKEAPTTKYRTQFVGRGGKVLKEVIANPAVYTFTGDEMYVRARVLDSNGKTAWVQPVFLSVTFPSGRTPLPCSRGASLAR